MAKYFQWEAAAEKLLRGQALELLGLQSGLLYFLCDLGHVTHSLCSHFLIGEMDIIRVTTSKDLFKRINKMTDTSEAVGMPGTDYCVYYHYYF